MANSVLECRDLSVSRGGVEVVHQLNFELDEGLVTGLLGPSGCGKTTLIRAVAGTQVHTGQLTVLGRPAGHPRLRHEIGYAAQTAAVYLDLTVEENIRYFARILGAPAGDMDRVSGATELDPVRGRLVGTLSGGQRSRVSLAVALLGTPRLLLLDEPTVGLDPVLREQLWALFGRLAADGLTLLVSSHVMDEAERCDKLLLMRDGALLTHDTPAALKQRTGSSDLDRAFLRLIRDADQATA